MLKFKLHYYLSDDTIEILNEKINGRDPVPKLLSRRKLPLPNSQTFVRAAGPLGPTDASSTQCYSWKDLHLGTYVEVFNRQLLLVDADPFTFEFYQRKFEPLGKPIKVDDGSRPMHLIKTPVPPHNGFGSEEDSLRSVYSIWPKKPTRDFSKSENCGKVMRFSIRMANPRSEDQSRLFVLIYYLIDDTISIREITLRNSGHMAGNFLRRGRVRKPAGNPSNAAPASTAAMGIWAPPPVIAYYTASDLFVGAVLELLGHRFVVYEADEYSLRYMESKGAPTFPHSDLTRVMVSIEKSTTSGLERLIAVLPPPHDRISGAAALKDLVDKAGLNVIPLHACITLARAARQFENKPREKGPFSSAALQSVLKL